MVKRHRYFVAAVDDRRIPTRNGAAQFQLIGESYGGVRDVGGTKFASDSPKALKTALTYHY